MSDTINPLRAPATAAYQAVLEMVKAGKISNATMFNREFTDLLENFRAEGARLKESKEQ